jgi:hypothetical protein
MGPVQKGQDVFLDFLTLQGGTDKLPKTTVKN